VVIWISFVTLSDHCQVAVYSVVRWQHVPHN